jgi:aryl-alcohol dehydrogenase-like predicted oxidoreductase
MSLKDFSFGKNTSGGSEAPKMKYVRYTFILFLPSLLSCISVDMEELSNPFCLISKSHLWLELHLTPHRLGRSGLKISAVILGTMGYGSPKYGEPWVLYVSSPFPLFLSSNLSHSDAEKSLPLLHHAYKRGINTWDTADFYSFGDAERIIGRAITEYSIPRSKLVIMTKCFFGTDASQIMVDSKISPQRAMINDGAMVNCVGLSRKHIMDAVDASVERLGTYIDVLQIHRLDHETPAEEIMRALNDVVESGKVRYLGASSMRTWEFQHLNHVAERHGWHTFISMQNYHNLLYREEEREMHPYCAHAGIGLVPWSPLAQGVLARPWKASETTRSQDNSYQALLSSEGDKGVVDRLEEVSKKLGVSMAKVAIAWSLKKGVNPILGLSSIARIDEAVETVGFELSDEDMAALEEVYRAKPVAPVAA